MILILPVNTATGLFYWIKGSLSKIGTPIQVLDYKTIESVYKTVVIVEKSPISGSHMFFWSAGIICMKTIVKKGALIILIKN